MMKRNYDFVVCGSGSCGSVIARRLAENPDVSVLLLEAGGSDESEAVLDPVRWLTNIGSERDWGFHARPSAAVNGRSLPYSMGKVVGGGSSINAMIWSRGHKNDWNHFADETADSAWSYAAVLETYRRLEDWHGPADPERRGTGGLLFVQPVPEQDPVGPRTLEAAASLGIPRFSDSNGLIREKPGGCAPIDARIRDGRRLSIFRTYVQPYVSKPNLTVLTRALVTRVLFDGKGAVGVEIQLDGRMDRIRADREIVLSLGAIHTPKVLMQSGVGDEDELRRFGIDVVQHLPGIGCNLQDHLFLVGCQWECDQPIPLGRNAGPSANVFWKSSAELDTPDLNLFAGKLLGIPPSSWMICPSVMRPRSRGRLRLTGPNPSDPIDIDAGFLNDPADLKAMLVAVELCRDIGNSAAMRPFNKREVAPGDVRGPALERLVREKVGTLWHQSGTAKMGRDRMSAVDGQLRVYGLERLRVADASVMPRVTTGNTMAPCVIIGERAAESIRRQHGL